MKIVKIFPEALVADSHKTVFGTARGNLTKIILLIAVLISMTVLSSCFVPYYGDDGPYEYYGHHGYRGYRHYEGRGGEHHEGSGGERHEGGEHHGGGEHHEGGEHHDRH